MAKKKGKKSGLTGGDILIAVLIALASALGFFLVVLVAGSLLFPESWERQTADQPPAVTQTTRGTLPSSTPTPTPTRAPEPTEPQEDPSDIPEPKQTTEPVRQTSKPAAEPSQAPLPAQTQAPAPAQTKAPTAMPSSAPAQNSGPVVSINPTTTPAQSGNNTQVNGRTVYVTPSGDHWHYDNNCNGGNYYIPEPGEIERRGLTPCSRCVS